MDGFVDLEDLPVLRLRADFDQGGPAAAFRALESKLPTLRGRHFYGCVEVTQNGFAYFACVVKIPSDDPATLSLETGLIPGGVYARRRVTDWGSKTSTFAAIHRELAMKYGGDMSRPSLEFYRSATEAFLMVPVLRRPEVRSD